MERNVLVIERDHYASISIITKKGNNITIVIDDMWDTISVKSKTGPINISPCNNSEITIGLPEL